jgi:hypothetical protein
VPPLRVSSVYEQECLSFREQFLQNYHTSSDPTVRQAAAELLVRKHDNTMRLVSFDMFLHLIKDENALVQFLAWGSLYNCLPALSLPEILQILDIITTIFEEANNEFQDLYVQCLQNLPYFDAEEAVMEKTLHFIGNTLTHQT